jgi:transposase
MPTATINVTPVVSRDARPALITVIGGVDTHGDTHHAAAVNAATGAVLGDQEFQSTPAGYQQLLGWLTSFGRVEKVGIEGTGSYGAGLNRHLDDQDITVIEVDRPNRRARRLTGKSDPLDAIAAARAVLSGQARTVPKERGGPVEAIRIIKVARRSAVKAHTAALLQMKSLIVAAPDDLRAELKSLSPTKLLTRCAQFEPATKTAELLKPAVALQIALQRLAHRATELRAEIDAATRQLTAMVTKTAPNTLNMFGVGPNVAAQLLCTVGDNPHRITSEAALAKLCGTAPIPASSGKTTRHRLHRGGDRDANAAIYFIVLTRMQRDQTTKDYVERRTKEGLSKQDIIRCLKRFVIREIYRNIKKDFPNTTPALDET